MSDNENKKVHGELTDEALDKVTGGVGGFMDMDDIDIFKNFYFPCHACSRRDETVKWLTIDYGDGSSSTQYLCSVCADRYRQTYKVY